MTTSKKMENIKARKKKNGNNICDDETLCNHCDTAVILIFVFFLFLLLLAPFFLSGDEQKYKSHVIRDRNNNPESDPNFSIRNYECYIERSLAADPAV